MADIELPSSPALQKFKDIAWDGYDSTDSEWDSCEVGCSIPIYENHLCAGLSQSDDVRGLRDYEFKAAYCVRSSSSRYCCSNSVGDASACVAAENDNGVRECESAWDVNCFIPKHGDGGQCSDATECSSSSCQGGRCCNAYGQTAGCTACDVSGNCLQCGPGFVRKGPVCIDECACSAGCTDCNCGVCNACDGNYYITTDGTGKCIPKQGIGSDCSADNMCTSNRCAGGNCCDISKVNPGCTDCNFRGLCDECGDGYTLCGHHSAGHGQCYVTQEDTSTTFRCGTGGDDTDYPSSDGYNYCALANDCPCSGAGCYKECTISHTCWVNGPAFERRPSDAEYNPFPGLTTRTSTTTMTSTTTTSSSSSTSTSTSTSTARIAVDVGDAIVTGTPALNTDVGSNGGDGGGGAGGGGTGEGGGGSAGAGAGVGETEIKTEVNLAADVAAAELALAAASTAKDQADAALQAAQIVLEQLLESTDADTVAAAEAAVAAASSGVAEADAALFAATQNLANIATMDHSGATFAIANMIAAAAVAAIAADIAAQ
eukprot:gene12719-24470_t